MTTRTARVLVGGAACIALLATPVHTAYKGHADDGDINAVLSVYPAVKGKPADACATCHRGGEVPDPAQPGATRRESHCDFCHAVFVAGKQDIKLTLNAFGADYLAAGRGAAAIKAIAAKDSDGDGFTNEAEILQGTDPGNRGSSPSVKIAPSRTFTSVEVRSLAPVVREVVLLNTTKSRSGDAYNEYRGTRLYDALKAIGVSDAADSIDVISLDGFEKTFTMAELKADWPMGSPVLGLGAADLGACGWVSYNAPGLDAKKPLPPASIILAFEENGKTFERAAADPATGKLQGTGPFRVITPQTPASGPDLSERADPSCVAKVAPERRFHPEYDHNGGQSPYAIVAVRVKPLPAGTRDVDFASIGPELVAHDRIVFFGAIAPAGTEGRRH